MAQTSIDVQINAIVKDATNAIKSFSSEATKSVKKVEDSFDSLATIAKAAVAFLAGREIFRFLEGAVDEAANAEVALNKLNTALKLSGDYSDAASKQMQEFAAQIQKTSVYDDDLVISQLAVAKSFGVSNEQAEKLVQAATDLSAVTGDSLNASVEQLGRTLTGTAGALGKTIPGFKLLTEEQLRAGSAIDFITSRFGGAAQDALNTFSGAVAQTKNEYLDFIQAIGETITQNPAVIVGIKGLGSAFEAAQKAVEANKTAIIALTREAFVGLIKVIPFLLEGLNLINDGFSFIVSTSYKLAAAINYVKGGVSAFFQDTDIGKKAVLAGFQQGTEALLKESDQAKKNGEARKKVIDELIASVDKSIDKTVDQINADNELTKSYIKNRADQKLALEQLTELERKRRIEANQRIAIESGTKNIIGAFNGSTFNQLDKKEGVTNTTVQIGAVAQIGDSVFKGAQGAVNLFSQVIGEIANTVLPGIGAIVGQIFQVLAQGPEKVRETIKAFAEAIPQIIENVVNAIIELPNILIDAAPRLIAKLLELLPQIAEKFAFYLAAQAPFLAQRFMIEMIKNIPEFVKAFAEGIKNAVSDLVGSIQNIGGGLFGGGSGGIGGFIGGVVSDVGNFFGFAQGGLIPEGFPNDSFPARLTSGEYVIERSQNRQLQDFLDSQKNDSDPQGLKAEIQKLRNENTSNASGTQNLTIKLQVGEKELADVLLNLNRQGFRVTT